MGECAAIYTLFSHFSVWVPLLASSCFGLCHSVETEPSRHPTHCDRLSAESVHSSTTIPLRLLTVLLNYPVHGIITFPLTKNPILIRAKVGSLRIEWLFVCPIGVCPFVLSLGRSPWQSAGAASSSSAISILKPFTSLWLSIAINSITATLLMRRHNLAPVYSNVSTFSWFNIFLKNFMLTKLLRAGSCAFHVAMAATSSWQIWFLFCANVHQWLIWGFLIYHGYNQ